MQYEILSCTDDDAELIEEKAYLEFSTAAPPEPGAKDEEYHCELPTFKDAGFPFHRQ
ncbi:MAG: hypothetical protein II464_08435 [Oscillospiraceae bacterium]|nr:hypothetical protein [Oscillospiraceae bacterium]